jgi:nucleotide-binding universal stress UspA family protein
MGATEVLLLVVLIWALIGVATALVMGRRGHHPFTWLVLSLALGPLVIPVAASSSRRDRPRLLRQLGPGLEGVGEVDVLVGIDGSDESSSALDAVIDIVRTRIRRLTLAGVIDYDSAAAGRPWETEDRAERALSVMASRIPDQAPETVLLAGDPSQALIDFAKQEGFGLLVVGRRGHGASTRLLGSVATRLSHGAEVPVLIV